MSSNTLRKRSKRFRRNWFALLFGFTLLKYLFNFKHCEKTNYFSLIAFTFVLIESRYKTSGCKKRKVTKNQG